MVEEHGLLWGRDEGTKKRRETREELVFFYDFWS